MYHTSDLERNGYQSRALSRPSNSMKGRTMANFATQRKNMVESQVRPSDVTDRRVMTAMQSVPRETFLPEDMAAIAYADTDLPVSLKSDAGVSKATLLAPRVFGKLVQHLEIGEANVVLDIACATGYSTAILSHIAQTVVAIDQDPAMVAFAAAAIEKCGIDNAVVMQRPLVEGHADEGPYDAILINGMVQHVPPALLDQLKDGGRLVTIEGQGGFGSATQWRRLGTTFDKRWLFDAGAPALTAFDRPREFVF
ncbi:MAG: protein-L-isoaspartate O-methyltransferase [Hyphomicrobiaceae bacterium]|nr:protein-L-isoaspartate O-methyltransferase [Hyphomicrobiaceae bacterium]